MRFGDKKAMGATGTSVGHVYHPFQGLIIDFRFDMMGKRIYKSYVNLSNIVVRISDGTPEGKEHAVLFNAHLDSTLPSPGAADDALSVGIMLDCMRVLIETPDWSPKHAIIFRKVIFSLFPDPSDHSFAVFNHAEESLQDGSHLFSTQHPIAPTWVSLDIFAFSILTPMSASELPSILKVSPYSQVTPLRIIKTFLNSCWHIGARNFIPSNI